MLLTRAPVATKILLFRAAPRLACVKPIASVHPEPGSNSSLYKFCFVLSLQGRLSFLDGSIFTQNLLFLYYLYLTIPKSDSCAFPPRKKSAPQRYLFRIPHLASPTLGLLYLWKAGAKVGAFSFTCKFSCKKNLNNFRAFRQTPDLTSVNQEKKFQEKKTGSHVRTG